VSFKETDYHVRVASNVKEACELVNAGFQYVTGEYADGGKIFKKAVTGGVAGICSHKPLCITCF
jgi:hypothetical protein